MSNFAEYLTNFNFLIYAAIAITFLFFGVLIGYRFGKEEQLR